MQSKIFHIIITILIVLVIAGMGYGYWSLTNQIRDVETSVSTVKKTVQNIPDGVDLDLSQPSQPSAPSTATQPAETDLQQVIAGYAQKVIQAIEGKDMATWANYVHPEKGIRFSPYYNVGQKDMVFTTDQLKNALTDDIKYEWGAYDGTGLSIDSTFEEYYNKFIYDAEFAKVNAVSMNSFQATGNTVNNILEVYPQAMTVEFYISGIEEQYKGMDWRSLVLVFEQYQGQWYLVGIVHGAWTI